MLHTFVYIVISNTSVLIIVTVRQHFTGSKNKQHQTQIIIITIIHSIIYIYYNYKAYNACTTTIIFQMIQ